MMNIFSCACGASVSTDEWIKKMWYIYLMEYYSAIKKNKIMPFAATWMELEALILSEIRERQMPYDLTHISYLIYSTNEPGHREEIHGRGEESCRCRGGGGGSGRDWEYEVI